MPYAYEGGFRAPRHPRAHARHRPADRGAGSRPPGPPAVPALRRLNPRVYGPIIRAVTRSLVAIARGREKGPAAKQEGGRLGLPADFLIAPDGTVIAKKYGTHAYDQWSVDELLKHASGAPATTS
jgi:hypothetical protein